MRTLYCIVRHEEHLFKKWKDICRVDIIQSFTLSSVSISFFWKDLEGKDIKKKKKYKKTAHIAFSQHEIWSKSENLINFKQIL